MILRVDLGASPNANENFTIGFNLFAKWMDDNLDIVEPLVGCLYAQWREFTDFVLGLGDLRKLTSRELMEFFWNAAVNNDVSPETVLGDFGVKGLDELCVVATEDEKLQRFLGDLQQFVIITPGMSKADLSISPPGSDIQDPELPCEAPLIVNFEGGLEKLRFMGFGSKARWCVLRRGRFAYFKRGEQVPLCVLDFTSARPIIEHRDNCLAISFPDDSQLFEFKTNGLPSEIEAWVNALRIHVEAFSPMEPQDIPPKPDVPYKWYPCW